MKNLDLDKFAPEDREVKINGLALKVAGDVSFGVMLKIIANTMLPHGEERVMGQVEICREILSEKNDIPEDFFQKLTRTQIVKLTEFLFNPDLIQEEVEKEKKEDSGVEAK